MWITNALPRNSKGAVAWLYIVVIALIVLAILMFAIIQGKDIIGGILGKIAESMS